MQTTKFNHYLHATMDPRRKRTAGLDVLDLLVDSYSKDDGSYNFYSTHENTRSVCNILIHNYGLEIGGFLQNS